MTCVLMSLEDELINILYKQEIFGSDFSWTIEFRVKGHLSSEIQAL